MTSRHSSRFFMGEKLKFIDSSRSGVDSCASMAHRMRKDLHFVANHSTIWSSIQFYLFFSFIFSSFPDVCFFMPIVTFHLSPSNENTRRERERHLESLAQHSSLLVGSINVWTATKYFVFVYSGLSFLHLFSDNQREPKSYSRRQLNKWWSPPPHTMIAQNILTSFDVCAFFCAYLKCPFYKLTIDNRRFSFVIFISGSLEKFIGFDPFFSSHCSC